MVEAQPGERVRCGDCGFTAEAPLGATETPSMPVPVDRRSLITPFAFLCALVGLGTYYLAAFGVPFLASVAAVALGGVGRRHEPKNGMALASQAIGACSFLVAAVYLLMD